MVMKKEIATDQREIKGLTIVKKDRQIKRIDDFNYEVLSQSGNGTYLVPLQTLMAHLCN